MVRQQLPTAGSTRCHILKRREMIKLTIGSVAGVSDFLCSHLMSALYMDSSSLANNFFDQNSDANVYLAFRGRRYLLAHYVYALRFL